MRRLQVKAFVSGTFLAAFAGAQPINQPLKVTISNAPLPVSIRPAPAPSPIVCSFVSAGSFHNKNAFTIGHLSGKLQCPPGTNGIDLRRIVVAPGVRPAGELAQFTGYLISIKIGILESPIPSRVPNPTIVAVLSNAAPQVSFTEPVRLNFSTRFGELGFEADEFIHSEIAGGIKWGLETFYFFGTAVE